MGRAGAGPKVTRCRTSRLRKPSAQRRAAAPHHGLSPGAYLSGDNSSRQRRMGPRTAYSRSSPRTTSNAAGSNTNAQLDDGRRTLEAITALANTFGGVVLVGVDEDKARTRPAHRRPRYRTKQARQLVLEPANAAVQPGDHPHQPRPRRPLRLGHRHQYRLHPPTHHDQQGQQGPRPPRRPEPGTRLVPAPRPVHRTGTWLPRPQPATSRPQHLHRHHTPTQTWPYAACSSSQARADAPPRSPAPHAHSPRHPQQQRHPPHRHQDS